MLNFKVKIILVNADFCLKKNLDADFCPKNGGYKVWMLTSATLPDPLYWPGNIFIVENY